ncbi:MAG TPA: class I SAM-dependent methyltransferase [Candidatus Acidoferrales bacterium]|jgi:SAM-dependent methyltransferase|nr:class I SAM-dependent methyltransferase [Candidatus Acidoferrales bacterium]
MSDAEYSAVFAEFYDHTPLYQTRADIAFYVDEARAAGSVLELGCGSGRILIPIAAAGVPVTGLDLSEAMLARCREKLAAQPPEVRARVRLVHASMTHFELAEKFALITTPFRAFQHLIAIDDQLACLRCAHWHLAPGGRLVLDMFQVNPSALTGDSEWLREREDTPETKLPDGRTFRRSARITAFHRAEQVNEVEFIIYLTHPDGRTERHTQTLPFRYFFPKEVEHLLARAGFRVATMYGNFDRSPLVNDSPEMLTLAEKV